MLLPLIVNRLEILKSSRTDARMPGGECAKLGRQVTNVGRWRLRPCFRALPGTPAGHTTILCSAPVSLEAAFGEGARVCESN